MVTGNSSLPNRNSMVHRFRAFSPFIANRLSSYCLVWCTALSMLGCEAKTTQPVTVIQIDNWHWVPRPYYAMDLKELDPTLTEAEIDERYAQYLNDVEELQLQQVELIRELSKTHGVKQIFYEGVTDENLEACHQSNARVKRVDDLHAELDALSGDSEAEDIRKKFELLRAGLREEAIQLGAIGQLIRSGEIDDYIPLEDAATLLAADPLGRDGKLRSNAAAEKAREDAMAKRLLATGPIVIVVLGGDHDLEDNLKKILPSVKYQKLQTIKYRELAKR